MDFYAEYPTFELTKFDDTHIKCQDCKVPFKFDEGIMYCAICGMEHDALSVELIDMKNSSKISSSAFDRDYNTNINSFMSFKVIGKGARRYQLVMLKTSADSDKYRNNVEKRQLLNYLYRYDGNNIPVDVAQDALNIFLSIKKHKIVFRGNTKLGIMAACLSYACIKHNISKNPREIADIFGIEDRFLSLGDRKLQEFAAKKYIELPDKLRPLPDYVDQLFAALEIPEKYKTFVIDLVNKAERKRLHTQIDSRALTRCAGSIYVLVSRVKELKYITATDIARESHVSKTTFIKYFDLIYANHVILKSIFKIHQIPMPRAWMA